MKEINSMETEKSLRVTLSLKRHTPVSCRLRGVLELKNELRKIRKEDQNNNNNSNGEACIDAIAHLPEIHQFLDGFYMSRIGMRMLILTTRWVGI